MKKIMIQEAEKFNTTVETLREQGFFFDENACGKCHWFAPCAEFGGKLMSLAWYRSQQEEFRARMKAMRKTKKM